MKITENAVRVYELNNDDVMFIHRVIKEKVGKYTLDELLSTEWALCFGYYVNLFDTLKKVYNRELRSDRDCYEIHWLLSFLGDVYNSDCSDEDKAKAKALCDAMGKDW